MSSGSNSTGSKVSSPKAKKSRSIDTDLQKLELDSDPESDLPPVLHRATVVPSPPPDSLPPSHNQWSDDESFDATPSPFDSPEHDEFMESDPEDIYNAPLSDMQCDQNTFQATSTDPTIQYNSPSGSDGGATQ